MSSSRNREGEGPRELAATTTSHGWPCQLVVSDAVMPEQQRQVQTRPTTAAAVMSAAHSSTPGCDDPTSA